MAKKTLLKWGVALAVMTTPALLSPGFAQGNGNGGKKGADEQGGKGQQGKPQRGPKGNNDRGSPGMKPQKQLEMPRANIELPRGNGNGDVWSAPNKKFRDIVEDNRGKWKRAAKRDYRPNAVVYRNNDDVKWLGFGNRNDYYDGCPPGLAKKQNDCMPPGLAKKREFYDGWWSRDNGYYRDGYLLRYEGDRALGFLPLLGGALGLGQVFPTYYQSYDVPDYYARYYGDDGDYIYRQADGVIYGLDPESYAIREIAGLVTGDEFAIGQPMPDGYSVYNVPYDYRDEYIDDEDSWYRYNDGYVYEVDPTTQLVSAVIQLLS